jgi:glutamyl-tRNA synthetase
LHLYTKYAGQLLAKKKAYRCFCDQTRLELVRREATKRQEKIAYDGKCSHLDEATVQEYLRAGRPNVIRFRLADRDIIFKDMTAGIHSSNPGKNEGDFIMIKSDGYPTYHFANVVDDHLMGISHVLRGQEWLLSTPKHIAIYEAFEWTPPEYGLFSN